MVDDKILKGREQNLFLRSRCQLIQYNSHLSAPKLPNKRLYQSNLPLNET